MKAVLRRRPPTVILFRAGRARITSATRAVRNSFNRIISKILDDGAAQGDRSIGENKASKVANRDLHDGDVVEQASDVIWEA